MSSLWVNSFALILLAVSRSLIVRALNSASYLIVDCPVSCSSISPNSLSLISSASYFCFASAEFYIKFCVAR